MGSGRRILLTFVALVSVAATVVAFVRETQAGGAGRPAAARAHLTAADLRAAGEPVSYSGAIPVINFHDVSPRPGLYSVPPTSFATDLAALRRAGFHTVTLAQVRDLVRGLNPRLPSHPFLITFDDGIASEYTYADRVLAANGFSAVSFLITARVGDGRKPSYYLSWPQVAKLQATGRWDFESHTDDGHHSISVGAGRSGPWLTNLLVDGTAREAIASWRRRVDRDLAASVLELREHTGRQPVAFAYPFAASAFPTNDAALLREVPAAVGRHFQLAFMSDLRPPAAVDRHSDRLLLPRFEVTSQVDVPALFGALRHMVPTSPGGDAGAWQLTGSACSIDGGVVRLTAPNYALCPPSINGSQWIDYRISLRATGLVGRSTLVALFRTNDHGHAELSVGSRRAVLRTLVGHTYRTLGTWTIGGPGDGGRHAITISLAGTACQIDIDGVAFGTQTLPRDLGYGAPGLGIAGGGVITAVAGVAPLRTGVTTG